MIITSCVAFAAGRSGAIGYAGYFIVQIAIIYGANQRLRTHFSRCPSVAARDRHHQEVHLKEEEVADKRRRLEENRMKIAGNDQTEQNLAGQLQAAIAEITGRQGQEIKQLYTEQAVARSEWAKRKQVVVADEERELRATTGRFDNDAALTANQINRLATKEGEMSRDALERIRKDMMNTFLSRPSYFRSNALGNRNTV